MSRRRSLRLQLEAAWQEAQSRYHEAIRRIKQLTDLDDAYFRREFMQDPSRFARRLTNILQDVYNREAALANRQFSEDPYNARHFLPGFEPPPLESASKKQKSGPTQYSGNPVVPFFPDLFGYSNPILDRPGSVTDRPAAPPSTAPISTMSRHTSYPADHATVSLGHLKLNHKGGPRGDKIYDEDIIGDWQRFAYTNAEINETIANNKHFYFISPTRAGVPYVDKSGTVKSIAHFTPLTAVTSSTDKDSEVAGKFNSVHQQWICTDTVMGVATRMDQDFHPQYGAPPAGVNDSNRSGEMLALRNQYCQIHFKNAITTTGIASSESCAHLTIFALQAKQDIHHVNPADVTPTGLVNLEGLWMANGWKSAYDTTTGGYLGTTYQPMYSLLKENALFHEMWDIVDTHSCTLSYGQEGIINMSIPYPQILSYQHTLRADPVSSALANPVYIKRGEQHIMYRVHGSLAIDSTNLCVIEPVKIATWITSSFEAARMSVAGLGKKHKSDSNAGPHVSTVADPHTLHA